jgi:PTH1 family peptidyl-tRNA hydrolase
LKYLIAGLGNIGEEYSGTRHNIGFTILDALASASNVTFKDSRLAFSENLK